MAKIDLLCRVCGKAALEEFPQFARLPRVTSDCRPFPAGGRLAICGECAAVQKPVDARWREEAAAIYAAYDVYFQSGGVEQAVFDPGTGAPRRRSAVLVDRLASNRKITETGTVLDVGCGNGALLSAFAEIRPGWRLFGHDLSEINRAALSRIPRFEQLVYRTDGCGSRRLRSCHAQPFARGFYPTGRGVDEPTYEARGGRLPVHRGAGCSGNPVRPAGRRSCLSFHCRHRVSGAGARPLRPADHRSGLGGQGAFGRRRAGCWSAADGGAAASARPTGRGAARLASGLDRRRARSGGNRAIIRPVRHLRRGDVAVRRGRRRGRILCRRGPEPARPAFARSPDPAPRRCPGGRYGLCPADPAGRPGRRRPCIGLGRRLPSAARLSGGVGPHALALLPWPIWSVVR